MGTLGRIILILLVVVIGVMVVLPFIFNLIGINLFQLGGQREGGFFGGSAKESILLSFGGKEWMSVSYVRDQKTKIPAQFLDFSFHPHDPGIIFLGTRGNGLWKSSDAGKTWVKTMDPTQALMADGDVYKVAVAPSNASVMYVAVYQNNRGRLLKSEDQGNTFREVYFVSADQFGVFDVYVDSHDANHVFMVTGQGGLLETRDGGVSWHVRYWFFEALTRLAVNQDDQSEIYIVTQRGGILRTVDGGKNWHDVLKNFQEQTKVRSSGQGRPAPTVPTFSFSSSLHGADATTIFFDPHDFSTLYLVRGSELWRSENSGTSWGRVEIIVSPNDGSIGAFAVDPRNYSLFFASVSNQLYRSDDGGNEWRISTLPIIGRINRLSISPRLDIMLAVVAK